MAINKYDTKSIKEKHFVEYCSIKPRSHAYFARCINPSGGSSWKPKKLHKKSYITKQRELINQALDYLLITSPLQFTYCKVQQKRFAFRLNFITLTLSASQMHCDKFIKEKLLEPFLRWILQKGGTGYVWKAEVQKNGNIHFHITTNIYIHYQSIRNKWNNLQFKYGYLAKYMNEHGHFDANSTDVKSVKNINKAFLYMAKYITKVEVGKRMICGHFFGYSRNLANVKVIIETLSKEFPAIDDYLRSKTTHTEKYEYCTVNSHTILDFKDMPRVLYDAINTAINPDYLPV